MSIAIDAYAPLLRECRVLRNREPRTDYSGVLQSDEAIAHCRSQSLLAEQCAAEPGANWEVWMRVAYKFADRAEALEIKAGAAGSFAS